MLQEQLLLSRVGWKQALRSTTSTVNLSYNLTDLKKRSREPPKHCPFFFYAYSVFKTERARSPYRKFPPIMFSLLHAPFHFLEPVGFSQALIY